MLLRKLLDHPALIRENLCPKLDNNNNNNNNNNNIKKIGRKKIKLDEASVSF